jgi:hypothetical protein
MSAHSLDKKSGSMKLFPHPQLLSSNKRFLCIENAGELPAVRINVLLNWTAELTGK